MTHVILLQPLNVVIGQAERTKFEFATKLDLLKFLRTFYRQEDFSNDVTQIKLEPSSNNGIAILARSTIPHFDLSHLTC